MSASDPLVVVCQHPCDRERARVRLSALDEVRFDTYSTGIRSRFPRQMIVATVAMADIEDGKLNHPAQYRMKVAITRVHNQTTFPILERIAAAKRMGQLAPAPRVRTRLNPPQIPQRPAP